MIVIGLLIWMFMTAGGRRKWKTRYSDEISRRETLELTLKVRVAYWAARDKAREYELATREKEWREQDSLRAAAIKERERDSVADAREVDRRQAERRTADERDAIADARRGDKDLDGVPDDRDPIDNRPV